MGKKDFLRVAAASIFFISKRLYLLPGPMHARQPARPLRARPRDSAPRFREVFCCYPSPT